VSSDQLSTAFNLQVDSHVHEIQRVLALIDRLHHVEPLPRIPIDHKTLPGDRGGFRVQINRGRPLGIGIAPEEQRPAIVLLHEIGHLIDHQALGTPGGFSSRRHTELADWRRAVSQSRAFRELVRLQRASNVELGAYIDSDSLFEARLTVQYLLLAKEAWAQSYVHFVVAETDDAELRSQLAQERMEASVINQLGFWDDGDFAPIHSSISALFRKKGWLQ
jgi:hypothetical protein